MSCKLEEAIKDIEVLASKPGAKSIAKELTQIANEAKESVEMLLKRKIIEKLSGSVEYAEQSLNIEMQTKVQDTKLAQTYVKAFKELNERLIKATIKVDANLLYEDAAKAISERIPGRYHNIAHTIKIVPEKPIEAELRIAEARGYDILELAELERLYANDMDLIEFVQESKFNKKLKEEMVDKRVENTLEYLKNLDMGHVEVHEIIHAAAYRFMDKKQTGKREKAIQERIELLFDQAKKRAGYNSEWGVGDPYWTRDVHEFIAEALSNPEVIRLLDNMQTFNPLEKLSTILKVLVDALVSLVSTSKNKDSIYAYTMDGLMALIEVQNINTDGAVSSELRKLAKEKLELLKSSESLEDKIIRKMGNAITLTKLNENGNNKKWKDLPLNRVELNDDRSKITIHTTIGTSNVSYTFPIDKKKSYKTATGVEVENEWLYHIAPQAIKEWEAENDVLGAKASKEKPSFDKFTELEADIHGNPEKMVDLLNKINELDASPETEEHMEYLRGLIKQLNPDFMRKAKTYILESAIENGGMVIGKDIGIMVGRNAKTAGNQQSAAEIYVHEVIHAYTKFAVKLAKDGDVEARKILRELQYVKKVAMENMTWKDFMPKDSIDATKEEAEAKERYDYIFDVNTRGLKDWKPHGHSEDEFMAHILTNPIVSKKAKFIKLKEQHKEMTLWEKTKELFDTITGWLLGDFRFKDRTKNVQELTLELVGMFAEFNNKAVTEARKKENVIEKLKDQFDSIEEDTSAWIGEQLDKVLPKEARIGPKPSNPLAQTKWYATAFAKLMLTPIGRKELSKLLKAMGMPMYGSIQSIIRDFVESDQLEKTIDWLALQADKVDQSKMNVIGTVKQHLKDAFTKPLSDYEEEAITKVLLDTDLQSISKEYTNLQLRNMLTDEEVLHKEIGKAKHELKMLDEKNYNWHTDQATGLGQYLATGKIHIAQNTSVLGIAKGHLGAEYRRGWKHKKGDLELLLNKVSTLVALEYTGKQEKTKIAELLKTERKGITTVLDTARFLEKEAKETIFKGQELFMVKGYAKELFDDSVTMEIVPVSKHDEMVKRGFKKIKDMESHSLVRTKEKYAMYVSNAFATNEWNRQATRLTKMQTKGTSLKELYYNEQDSYSEKRHLINKLKIDQARYAIVKSQLDGTFDINSVEYGMAPLLDEYGEVVDYRYMMEKDAKKDLLKQDTGMGNVLGATRGAILDKQQTIEHNKNVLKLIKEDAKENYIDGSDIGKNSMAYILLTPDSINAHIKDLWEVLPKEFKKEAMRNSYKGLAVREDMLANYFGYRHLSITNVNWLKAITPGFILNMVKIAEAMWIEFIKITKVDILIKMPFVIVGNILSNIMYGISTGSSPMEILSMYRESTIDVRKYLSKHRELIKLEEAGKIGKISQHDKNRIEVLKQELKKSPIHELYELGIYQAIVEDVSQEELSSSNKLKKEYKKRTSAIPKVIKDGMNWIYLTEETQYYKVMTEVLQMSDLVARDIENRKLKKVIEQQAKGEKKIPMWYVNYVENAKDEVATRLQATMVWKDRNRKMDAEERAYFREAAKNYRLNNVLNAFVNYNKPSGSMEEYLNKIGLIMFTKYAKRIQRVIAQTGAKYPIRTLMLLLTDAYVLDMDTIQNQSIFTKSWYNLTPQWPLERIMDVFTPPIIQPSTYRII